jgi:signal transduction histidine kinase
VSPSLEELASRFAESSGVTIEFRKEQACGNCANEHLTQLYRIAQEAISNAVKHARAERIVVALSCLPRGAITLSVRDDGIGRSSAKKTTGGLGLGIMAHRAQLIGGSLSIENATAGGTVVTCTVPCPTCQTKVAD